MFKSSPCRYSTGPQMALDIPLQKTNTVQKILSFLEPKEWSKIDQGIKNVRTCLLLCVLLSIKYFTSSEKLVQIISTFL